VVVTDGGLVGQGVEVGVLVMVGVGTLTRGALVAHPVSVASAMESRQIIGCRFREIVIVAAFLNRWQGAVAKNEALTSLPKRALMMSLSRSSSNTQSQQTVVV
jgi:hypothetical protein